MSESLAVAESNSSLIVADPVLPQRVTEQVLTRALQAAWQAGQFCVAAVGAGYLEHVIFDKDGSADYFAAHDLRAQKYDISYGSRHAEYDLVVLKGLTYGGIMRRTGSWRRRQLEVVPTDIQANDRIVLVNHHHGQAHQFTTERVIQTGIAGPWSHLDGAATDLQ